MNFLNLIWPAIYIVEDIGKFWFLIFFTIAIETITIYAFLKINWKKSIIISMIGNSVSGIIGTFIMMFAMLIWHFAVDRLLPNATFDKINWIATYIIMCLGSVSIETYAISKIFKFDFKKTFIPLLIGNALSYGFIAYATAKQNEVQKAKEKPTENVFYKPLQNKYNLLNNKNVIFYTAKTEVNYDNEDKISNENFPLEIIFEYNYKDIMNFPFELRLAGNEFAGGIENGRKTIYLDKLSDTIRVVLEQKNPNEDIGWTKPIITDTIKFIKSKTK